MYQKVDLVTSYVGNKKVNCELRLGWEFSMCSDKTINRLGFKIDRPISSEDREMKFFREMSTIPVGWSKLSLAFKSEKKHKSIITNTEVLVVKHHINMDDSIILGSPWFMGRSLKHEDIQIYKARIVIDIDMHDCYIRRILHIKSLRGHKNKWVRVPINETDSDSDSDSSSSSSSDFGILINKAILE